MRLLSLLSAAFVLICLVWSPFAGVRAEPCGEQYQCCDDGTGTPTCYSTCDGMTINQAAGGCACTCSAASTPCSICTPTSQNGKGSASAASPAPEAQTFQPATGVDELADLRDQLRQLKEDLKRTAEAAQMPSTEAHLSAEDTAAPNKGEAVTQGDLELEKIIEQLKREIFHRIGAQLREMQPIGDQFRKILQPIRDMFYWFLTVVVYQVEAIVRVFVVFSGVFGGLLSAADRNATEGARSYGTILFLCSLLVGLRDAFYLIVTFVGILCILAIIGSMKGNKQCSSSSSVTPRSEQFIPSSTVTLPRSAPRSSPRRRPRTDIKYF